MTKDLQARIANIKAAAPDEVDLQMIEELGSEADERGTSWDEYKTNRAERTFNGNISLRIPKDLHRELVDSAKEQGVSLNQYCLYKLAR